MTQAASVLLSASSIASAVTMAALARRRWCRDRIVAAALR
jgi:hypothetical protein